MNLKDPEYIWELDQKFKRLIPTEYKWLVHEWDNHGADYGFFIALQADRYDLITYADSGYTDPKIVVYDLNWGQLDNLIEHLAPTNPTYKTQRKADTTTGTEAIHTWFSLTYAAYLVIPRSVLQSMPDAWQQEFVKLLEQIPKTLEADFPGDGKTYYVQAKNRDGKFVEDEFKDYNRGRRRFPLKEDGKGQV